MPHNLIKQYPDLLEIRHYSEQDRTRSLRGIFDRDITNNENFAFRTNCIYPTKRDGEYDMGTLFKHLTCEELHLKDEKTGKKYAQRIYDHFRSERLHWVRYHIEENVRDGVVEVFSLTERDIKKRKDVVRTYIYNRTKKYVVVLEPQQRSGNAYYLLTAYYLNREYGEKQMNAKLKQRLNDVL